MFMHFYFMPCLGGLSGVFFFIFALMHFISCCAACLGGVAFAFLSMLHRVPCNALFIYQIILAEFRVFYMTYVDKWHVVVY